MSNGSRTCQTRVQRAASKGGGRPTEFEQAAAPSHIPTTEWRAGCLAPSLPGAKRHKFDKSAALHDHSWLRAVLVPGKNYAPAVSLLTNGKTPATPNRWTLPVIIDQQMHLERLATCRFRSSSLGLAHCPCRHPEKRARTDNTHD